MSKISDALKEVWEWKEKIYQERKDKSIDEWCEIAKSNTKELLKDYNIMRRTSEGINREEKNITVLT
ncbi:MAG: hypothetical protein ABRQ37_10730 [Candidatus Eremiobacterota bacterium]